jgi:homoserine kinase type II
MAPVVEMLWEAHDPHSALDGRFGFSDGESAGGWVAATLAEYWGVRVRSCERIVISDHNALAWLGTPSGRLLAKWSVVRGLFPRLSEMARLTGWLDSQGLPVSAPIPALDGRLQVEAGGVSMCLQHEIEGDLLDVADPTQVHAAGAALARLQDALASYPDADRIAALSGPPAPLTTRVTNWLDSGRSPTMARDALRELLAAAPSDPLPTQLVHLDFRSANILCAGSEVAAVIDFEETGIDHRIVELARSAVLLGTRFRDWGPVPAEVRVGFLAGYQSVRRLTPAEVGWWDILLLWQALAVVPAGDDPTGWGPSALSHLAELRGRANRAWRRPPRRGGPSRHRAGIEVRSSTTTPARHRQEPPRSRRASIDPICAASKHHGRAGSAGRSGPAGWRGTASTVTAAARCPRRGSPGKRRGAGAVPCPRRCW